MENILAKSLSSKPRLTEAELMAGVPAMPAIAGRAMKELADEKTSGQKVADIIALDQGLTAQILRIANSPVFGARRRVATIKDATVLLGFSGVKSLIISASTRGVFRHSGLMEQQNWEHSLGCALAATEIARVTLACPPDEAFVGGLLHDVGRAVFMSAYRDEYETLYRHIYNNDLPRSSLVELEREHLGLTHMEVGRMAVDKWGLPQALSEAVARHHARTEDELKGGGTPYLTAIVGLADALCLHLGIGLRMPDRTPALSDSLFAAQLQLESGKIEPLLNATAHAYETERAHFS